MKNQPESYLKLHPEIKTLITIFTQECIHFQPDQIKLFAKIFFQNTEVQNFVSQSFGFQTSDAHVAAQLNQELKETLQSHRLKTKNAEAFEMTQMVQNFAQNDSFSDKKNSFRNNRISARNIENSSGNNQLHTQSNNSGNNESLQSNLQMTKNQSSNQGQVDQYDIDSPAHLTNLVNQQPNQQNVIQHNSYQQNENQQKHFQTPVDSQTNQIHQINDSSKTNNSLCINNETDIQKELFIAENKESKIQIIDFQLMNNSNEIHPDIQLNTNAEDETLPEDIAPQVQISAQMHLTDSKVKLNQLSEFAHKSFTFQRLKDLGNVFLIQSPLRDQFINLQQLATTATFATAFPRALRIAPGNNLDYSKYSEMTFLLQPHIHGIGYLELLSGVEKLQSFLNTIFVCTNITTPLDSSAPTEFRYFEGLGKNIRYISSKYNIFNKHFYKYLPVLVKGNYKSAQVEDFCVIFVSFVPPVYYEREVILNENLDDSAEDLRKSGNLQQFELPEAVELRPLNCKFYENIIIETQENLRELGIKMSGNIKVVYLTSQRLTNFDEKKYRIQSEFFDVSMQYDNVNTEFYFDQIINSMDNRETEGYEDIKIQQIQLHHCKNYKNQMIQMVSFKNMVVIDELLVTNSINQLDLKDVKYMEPLMIFLDQTLQLNSGCGMVQDQILITSYKLLNQHYIKRLNLNIIHDASLMYISNVLKNQIISRYKSQLIPLNKLVSKLPQLVFCFSYKTLVGHGPLFDCIDIQHGLDCQKICQCKTKYIDQSSIFIDQITEENIYQFLPGCVDDHLGQLFMCTIPIRVLLKALIYHYSNNIFGSVFNHIGPSFIYYTGFGLCFNSQEPEKSFLFDQYAYKADILRQFQYQNLDGNLLSNVFLHREKYSTPSQKSAELGRLSPAQLDTEIYLVLDNGCFDPCGIVQTIKRYTNVVFEKLGHLKEVLKEQMSDGVSAQIDLDQCFPSCLVTDFNGPQHLLLQQRLGK